MEAFSSAMPPRILRFGKLAIASKLPETFPEWQVKAMKILLLKLLPTLTPRELDEFQNSETCTPSTEGKAYGHIYAMFKMLSTDFLPKIPEREKVGALLSNIWPYFFSGLNQLLADYTLAEARTFSKQFANALASSSDESEHFMGWMDYSLVLGCLLYFPEQVNESKNSAELHQRLTRILGQNLTGSLKRIRGICSDINLRFPDKGGRPKKQKLTAAPQRG